MKSIRRQLTLSLLTSFGWLLLTGGVAVWFFTRLALLGDFDAALRAKALALMSQAEQGNDGVQIERPGTFFQGKNNDVAPRFYELWRTNGTVGARSESLQGADLPLHYGSLASPVYWNVELPGDQDGRAIGLQFTVKPDEDEPNRSAAQDAILVVAADRGPLNETLTTLAMVLGAAGLLTILLTIPVVQVALRRGHAPLGILARQTAAINADSLQTRFSTKSLPGELQPIAQCLNELLARLADSFERERRFSADLAHELRTPLAELRTHAEVELAWPENGGTEKNRDILAIALQMECLVTRLLELARCENGKMPLHLEPVPLAALVEEIWTSLAARVQARSLAVEWAIPAEVVISTDRALLRSILMNLLANAVEYTPPSGRVEIRWHSDRGELIVSNTVHDLSPADVPHLFERLWRKDPSRTGAEHCGLGLALSRAMARVLGHELQARFTDEKTLAISLRKTPFTEPASVHDG